MSKGRTTSPRSSVPPPRARPAIAHGHLDYLSVVGDPATDLPIGSSRQNLKAAVAGETHEYTDMYPGMAKAARGEGFDEIADWFETLAKAERSHANRFQKALDQLTD
jgi:rubrerythrin